MAVEEWEAISSSEINSNGKTGAHASKPEDHDRHGEARNEPPGFIPETAAKKEGLEVLKDMLDDLGQLFDEEGHRWKAPIKESIIGCIGCMERACDETRSLLKKARQRIESPNH